MRAGFFGYLFSTVKLTSNQPTHNPGAYSYFSKLIMSHKRFPLLLGILIVAMLSACGKSEEFAVESVAVSEVSSNAQPADSASSTASAVPDTKQSTGTLENSAASSMADGIALAQKNNCFACHKIDTKLVGPAWRDVAKKYKGVADAEHKLVIKVSTGSVGSWGDMPMPAMAPAVKEEDIRALVKFVLSLEK